MRIDAGDDVGIGHLQQAQARPVGFLAQEFSVQGEPVMLAELLAQGLELFRGVDIKCSHLGLPVVSKGQVYRSMG